MPFVPKTPSSTSPGQLRQVLLTNVEDQMGLQTVAILPEGVAGITVRFGHDTAAGVDEALAALLNVLDANLTGQAKAQLAALRAQLGI